MAVAAPRATGAAARAARTAAGRGSGARTAPYARRPRPRDAARRASAETASPSAPRSASTVAVAQWRAFSRAGGRRAAEPRRCPRPPCRPLRRWRPGWPLGRHARRLAAAAGRAGARTSPGSRRPGPKAAARRPRADPATSCIYASAGRERTGDSLYSLPGLLLQSLRTKAGLLRDPSAHEHRYTTLARELPSVDCDGIRFARL